MRKASPLYPFDLRPLEQWDGEQVLTLELPNLIFRLERDGIKRLRDYDEQIRGLKGHESIAQALAWVSYFNGSALKGRQKSVRPP